MSVNVPIKTVTPANAVGNAIGAPVTTLPAPSSSDWGKSDLSAPDAGRLESGRMVKKRRGKANKINLEWRMVPISEASSILQTFDAEYVLVEYLDARLGQWVTRHFYTGDMQTTGYLPHVEMWQTVSLAIIQATPDGG